MVSHREIDNIMQTPKKELHFFFFSVCCIIFNCSWQLMFDKKQKSCVKCIHLVTDDGLYDWKAFYIVKIFYSSSFTQKCLEITQKCIKIKLLLTKRALFVKYYKGQHLTTRR